uniref:S8 family serine peptidase n=1 Tax=Ningiella ruwaisensis TaxID=2364274 RepID=UPI0010A03B3E|nr:S8 family serine peptidase [Ningiella ruwaisensis]
MKTKLSALTLAMLPLVVSGQTSASAPEVAADSILVVYKENTTRLDKARARSSIGARISDANRDEVDDRFSNLMQGRIAKYALRNMSVKDALKKLEGHPAIKYAEPNYIYRKALVPDDPSFGSLWGLNNTGQNGGTVDADIDAVEAWDISTGSSDIVIGVIDTGVDYLHEDLAANMWRNPNEIPNDGIDNDGNGYIDDIYGIDTANGDSDPMDNESHGTHVAGTIGAVGNNGVGVVGVNHNVSIAACAFLGSGGTGSTDGAIECVNYFTGLKNAGINVKATNNSWGGGGFSQTLKDAISDAEAADILFVVAAGNAGADNDTVPNYPSNYDNEGLMAVASINRNDADSGYSYGLTTVDIAAPGSAVLSTVPGNNYATFSGTSMATPHVAGTAALVWSINPDLSAVEMKQLLMDSGDDNAWADGRTVSGKRLNAYNALLAGDPTPSFTFSVTPTAATIVAGESISYTFEVGNIADWEGEVTLNLTDESGLATLSASTVSPGDTFTLDVATTEETDWGSYSFTVEGVSGELTREKTVSLYVNPVGLTDFPYDSTDTPIEIVDNQSFDSVINVPDEITVFGTATSVDISHTYRGDIELVLTSPAGTSVTLKSSNGGDGADDVVETFESAAFNGEVATGDWTLTVTDVFSGDTGQLNNWSITFTGIGEVGPAAPNAAFSFADNGLAVDFVNESTDVNNDIVSYLWDFGDGMTSTEESPSHIYPATGAYEVTLTATDAEGQSDTETQTVSVSDAVIEVTVKRAMQSRFGHLRVDLNYSGSSSEMVDVYRNGVLLETVENTGLYRDRERSVSGNSFTYVICDETTACSDPVTVSF